MDIAIIYSIDSPLSQAIHYKGVLEKLVIRLMNSYDSYYDTLLLLTNDTEDYSDIVGRKHIPCGYNGIGATLVYIWKTFFALRSIKDNLACVRIYGVTGGLPALLFGKIYKKKVILSYHYDWADQKSDVSWFLGTMASIIEKIVMPRVDVAITLTPTLKEKLIRIGCKEENVKIHPNYVDFSRFEAVSDEDKSAFKERFSSRDWNNKPIVSFVGRLHPVKNVDDILKTAKLTPECSFLIAGTGDEEEKLHNLKRKMALDNVFFLGGLDFKEVSTLCLISDLFIFPSSKEGHPCALIEAMGAGVPVIATDVIGINDVVNHKENGLLVPVHSPEMLAQQIRYLLDNPEKMKEIALKGKELALQEFSYTAWTQREISFLDGAKQS